MFPRFTLREILFATFAIAALVALAISSPKRKQFEDNGTRILNTPLLQHSLDTNGLRARIESAHLPGDRWGTMSVVSASRDDSMEILDVFRSSLANHLKANGFKPVTIIDASENRSCFALQWQSQYHIAGLTMVHLETIATTHANDGVRGADFEHRFAILVFAQ